MPRLPAAKKNLLLCFDAFGTLFRPKLPVEAQYVDVARQCGLVGISDDQIRSSFRTAFRAEAKANPNYGKQSAMGATQWWTNVIHNTFRPFLASGESQLPSELAPQLLRRFASADGYYMASHLPSLLATLQSQSGDARVYGQIVIGVITNSDDRVPEILSSFGLRVSPLRYTSSIEDGTAPCKTANGDYDIDFHCLSYDVGVEKPDRRMFKAAETLLSHIIKARSVPTATLAPNKSLEGSWDKLYVGDDYEKDIVGAQNAGWYPVFILGEGKEGHDALDNIKNLETHPPQPLSTLFTQQKVVRIQSLETLVQWLAGRIQE